MWFNRNHLVSAAHHDQMKIAFSRVVKMYKNDPLDMYETTWTVAVPRDGLVVGCVVREHRTLAENSLRVDFVRLIYATDPEINS